MPSLNEYFKGFGLRRGVVIDGYTLTQVEGTHDTVVRYRQYSYTLTLRFSPQSPQSNLNQLLPALQQYLAGPKILYTRWGNPYSCTVDRIDVTSILPNGEVIITGKGSAYRV